MADYDHRNYSIHDIKYHVLNSFKVLWGNIAFKRTSDARLWNKDYENHWK